MGTNSDVNSDRRSHTSNIMHEIPFEEGVPRVYTVIAIDERRDKELTLRGKVAAVRNRLKT